MTGHDEIRLNAADLGGRVELLRDLDRPHAWMLLVDGVPQSHVDLDEPRHLELEYVRRLGHVVDLAAPAGVPLRVLHLGGGGLTLARYVAATRPGSRQLAVEADAQVAGLVRRRLPTGPQAGGAGSSSRTAGTGTAGTAGTAGIEVRIADARAVLDQFPACSADLIIADVFTGAQTPAHVTTTEFTVAAARVLDPAGTYAVNISDGPPLVHARDRVAAILSVFRQACVIAEAAVLDGRELGNLVVAAAGGELPVTELARRAAADPAPARLLAGDDLARFLDGTRPASDGSAGPPAAAPPGVPG